MKKNAIAVSVKLLTMLSVTGSPGLVFAEDSALLLEEVVVTARKREENLQETPLSVVSFGGDLLESQDVTNILALDVKIPNVAIGGSGGLGSSNAAFFIRGIGSTRNAVNQESAVALYVDDSYYGRTDGALLSVMDVARIEVSRGPQGTLFGRSATSGAIRYITNNPVDELKGSVQLTLGSEDRRDIKGMVNVPLGDAVALRLVGASLNQDGYVKGVLSGKDYGEVGSDMVRAKLRWDITDKVETLFTLDYTQMDTDGGAAILLGVNPVAPFVGLEAGAGPEYDARVLPVGQYDKSYQTGENFIDSENTGGNFTLNWEISDDISFKSSTSWREIDIEGAYDADGTQASLFEQSYRRDVETFSQEFQLAGAAMGGSFDWVTGIFYYEEESSDERLVASTVNAGAPTSSTRIVDPIETESLAVYGQGTYDLNDRWSITAGLRYTKDEKDIFANELNAFGGEKVPGGVTNDDSWSAITGRLSLEWQATDDIFTFASFARGYRSGGFNDRIRTDLPDDNFGVSSFDEETLDMFELGIRSELFDNRLRLNLTAFYGEYTDQQLSALIPGTTRAVFQNAGESSLSGLEGEVIWVLSEILTMDATFALLDTQFDKLDEGVTGVTLDSEFARAPKKSFSVGLEADFEAIVARADYGWKDDANLVEVDGANIVQESYGLLSANITYKPIDASWSVSVFGNNLTDEEYLLGGLDLTTAAPTGTSAAEPGRFREYGIKFNWDF
jgi:iron complex outermembrane receptor protein